MNRKLLSWGIALSVFALNLTGVHGQSYDFAVVSNNAAAGFNLSAVANNGNTFVCVGGANSPTFAANPNNFSSFANSNVNGGYLLFSNAWANSLNSKIKYNWLSCVATQQVGFIASGVSNAVFVSTDGVNWTNLVHISPGDSPIVIGGIAYNPSSGTLADAEENNSASYTTNPTNGWQPSGLSGLSLAETFLAVASSSGSSDMAMCGILGDIRISTNGGKNWSISQQENSAMPNLTAVAYDTGSNLVCVGNSSLLEVGTNGGFSATNWTFQNKIVLGTAASPTNFNAVAYTSATSNFLAAGTLGGAGLIVMAPNIAPAAQWTWMRQTNIWALQNGVLARVTPALASLNGASFANNGFFQGIGMLVGNNGTILIAGLPPLAPANTAGNDVTNLLGSPQVNFPLGSTNDIVPDSNHPANVLGIDWYSAAVGGTELATNTAVFSPPGSLYNTCGVYTNWAQQRDLRTGFTSTNRTPFVFIIMPQAPTNAATGVTNALGTAYNPVWADVVVNAGSPAADFSVNWYTTPQGSNSLNFLNDGSESHTGNQFFHTPTNAACGTYTIWAETMATNTPNGVPLVSTNRTPVTFVIIPGAPTSPVNETNCAGNGAFGMCPNPSLSVTVTSPAGQTNEVNWYDGNSNFVGTAAFTGSDVFNFTPTNAVSGIYTFYAKTTNLPTGFVSTNWTAVTFQVNPLPLWTSSAGYITNVAIPAPQSNTVIQVPSLANGSFITNVFEPGSVITYDWYTNGDPNVYTYENQNFAYGENTSDNGVVPAFGGTPFIPTNRVYGSYTYYVRARVVEPGFTNCICQSSNLVAVTFNLLPPVASGASGGITNVLTGAVQINTPIWVDVVTNNDNQSKNFRVNWYSTSNSVANVDNSSDTNLANRFFHTPTNSLCGVFTNWAEVLAGGFTPGKSRFPVTFVIIPTAPSAVGSLDQTNCTEVPNPPFTVAVTNGQTANWFAGLPIGTPLTNTLSFIPTNSSPGIWAFSAQSVDTASGLSSTNSTTASLTLSNCTSPLTININPATGTGTIQWPGDLVLLSSSNLVNWTIVSTGSNFVAPNTLSWTNTNPPVQFFRLTN